MEEHNRIEHIKELERFHGHTLLFEAGSTSTNLIFKTPEPLKFEILLHDTCTHNTLILQK